MIKGEDGCYLKIRGVVIKKEEAFMFVQTEDFRRDIFVHTSYVSDSDWENLRVGTAVVVEVGFTMRGPIAASVARVEE